MRIGHLLSMCDDTGLFQHAVHAVPDRSHGYCVDDNARALLLACALNDPGEQRLSEVLTARLASFVQHAWNPDMAAFAISWASTETGWRRAVRKTAMAARCGRLANAPAVTPIRRGGDGQRRCLPKRLPPWRSFRSPRAWAFTLLGLDGYCASVAHRR